MVRVVVLRLLLLLVVMVRRGRGAVVRVVVVVAPVIVSAGPAAPAPARTARGLAKVATSRSPSAVIASGAEPLVLLLPPRCPLVNVHLLLLPPLALDGNGDQVGGGADDGDVGPGGGGGGSGRRRRGGKVGHGRGGGGSGCSGRPPRLLLLLRLLSLAPSADEGRGGLVDGGRAGQQRH